MTNNQSWFSRLKAGLVKTTNNISSGINNIFTKSKLDKVTKEQLEELLIEADIGASTANFIVKTLSENRFDKEISPEQIKLELAKIITNILQPSMQPIAIDNEAKPHIIIMCGVNGNGKTTTIGKLAQLYKKQGKSVMVAACDTFRAAAVSQLEVWAERAGVHVIQGEHNADAASVAYKAIEKAKEDKIDILLIDTAGRLHNKVNLMDELAKIIRIIKKLDETAPHNSILVLDATTGQNAYSQLDAFKKAINVTGLIVTKLDGTAKAGVIVGLAKKYNTAIHYIGIGEQAGDLRSFDAKSFASALVGLSEKY